MLDAARIRARAARARAWRRYLASTRALEGDAYRAREAEAWAELEAELGRVAARLEAVERLAGVRVGSVSPQDSAPAAIALDA